MHRFEIQADKAPEGSDVQSPPVRTWFSRVRAAPKQMMEFILYIGGVLLLFSAPLLALFRYATGEDLHSHILIVPLVSVYLLRLQWHRMPRDYKSSPWWAASCAAAGMGAFAYWWRGSGTSLNDSLGLVTASLVFFLFTGGFLFFGQRWMAAAIFPFAFLFFLVPLPDATVHHLERWSTVASAEVAFWFFSLSSTPVARDGMVFQLPSIVIKVATECSGIRSSWVLFITSVVAARMCLKSPWYRLILVTLVVPLGLLRNGFRIATIGWLCTEVGPQMIHSFIHRKGGPIFFLLALIPLFLALFYLIRSERTSTKEPLSERTAH